MSQVNAIWCYFSKLASSASKAQCNECKKVYSLGSDKPKLQTTHGLKNHLQKCHAELYALYLKKQSETNEERAAKKRKLERSSSANQPPNFVKHVQPTLLEVNSRQVAFPDEVVQRIDKAVMDMIIVDMLPFSVVEGEAFKRLNFADPAGIRRYTLKSAKFFRTSQLDATYEKVSNHVQALLSEAKWVSFTTDAWSNSAKTCSLLSFTAHFVHESVRRKVILSAMALDEDHTGEYLAGKLNESITKWNLVGKIHLGVRDNAANMIATMRIAAIADMGCMAHTLQLVIHDALFTQTSVESVVKKARRIVTHFKHSEQACRKFADCQQACSMPAHKLIQDVETRWNSTFLMLQRLVEQRKAIIMFSIDHGGYDSLTAAEWKLADRLVSLLQPFYEATLEISSDDAATSLVIPIITMLLGKMQITETDRGLLAMKAALRDALIRRFSYARSTPHIIASTLLDPRFKDIYLNAAEKAAGIAEIELFSASSVATDAAMQDSRSGGQINQPTEVVVEPSTSAATVTVPSFTLWDEHDNYAMANDTGADTTNKDCRQQLQEYLALPRLPRSGTNIYAYWNNSQFPLLEAAAKRYLSSPPTSVASEQLFSSAGQIYADRRSNLLGENAEKLLFLAYNIRLFGYNY